MPAIVCSVKTDSIAEDLEIKPGDKLISIDEVHPRDLIEYNYLTSSEEISLHIKRISGEEEIIDLEKDAEEDLGIEFESAVFDKVKPCFNKCIFCFVDQQPKGLRNSLYIKDDDWRLSYLQGTYITLTNLNQDDLARIEILRPGPLYVSVHTTNPDLRVKMLKNPNSKKILDSLKWLSDLDIPVHTQIVLCPGFNDGIELDKTLNDLSRFPNILSIAVVPVGITRFRNPQELQRVDKTKAEKVIDQIAKFNKKHGFNLAYPSDEFFITAEYELPESNFYGHFGQLDDGVGVCRMLFDDFKKHSAKLPEIVRSPKNLTLATGKIACETLEPIISKLNKIENVNIDLIPVTSSFWGENITVAGLITGQDLIDNLSPVKEKISNLIIPSVMLRKFTNEFLDNVTTDDIIKKLDTKLTVIENFYSTKEIIDQIRF